MKKEKKLLLIMIGLLSANNLFAQQPDSVKQLNTVTVTALRYEKDLAETPLSVTLITAEQIAQFPYQNVGELLSTEAGIYTVGAVQNPGSVQTLFLRGTNSNQTVIMIDGVRITDPSSVANAADLSELSLTNIERIEIIRGSHSTLYGTSAIGGVINIITKKFGIEEFSGSTEFKGGTFGNSTSDLTADLGFQYKHKSGFYGNFQGWHQQTNGLDATLDTVTTPGVFKNRDMDGFNKTDIHLKAGYQNKKWDIFAAYKRAQQLTDIDASAYRDDENYTLDFGRNLVNYGLKYLLNDQFSVSLTGGFSGMERKAVNDSSIIDELQNTDNSYYEASYMGTSTNHDLVLDFINKKKNIHVIGGGGMYGETMSYTTHYLNTAWMYESKTNLDSLDLNIGNYFGYLQTEWNGSLISEKLKAIDLLMGARFNNNTAFGSVLTYEANLSWRTNDNGLLFGSFSTGFNAPSLYQLYSPEEYYASGISRGNDQLDAEYSNSIEIGYKQRVNERVFIEGSLFNTTVKNAIEYVYLWDGAIGIDTLGNDWVRDDYRGDTYLNIGTLIATGMEFSVSARLSPKVLLKANVTVQSGRLEYDPKDIDTSHTGQNHVQLYGTGSFLTTATEQAVVARRPSTGNLTITWMPIEKLRLNFMARHTGARYDVFYDSGSGPYGALNTRGVREYTLFDAFGSFQFNKSLLFKIRVENILDTDYQDINGFTTRGRSFYGAVRLNF